MYSLISSLRRLWHWLRSCDAGWLALAFVPAVVLGSQVQKYNVDASVWDDWERVPVIEKFEKGTLTFKDLYAPHIEHRIFFPRLLFLALNHLSGGDLRWEVVAVFIIALLAALGVWRLAVLTLGAGKHLWGLLFLTNLILFSPMQYENWLWAIQTAFLLPMTCMVWALVVMRLPWSWGKKFAACLGLALIATHSFGHGMLIWPMVFGMALLLVQSEGSKAGRWLFLAGWTASAAAILGCYFLCDFTNVSDASHSYNRAPGETPPGWNAGGAVFQRPDRLVEFVLAQAGSPYYRLHLKDASEGGWWIGLLLVAAFSVAGIAYGIRRFKGGLDSWTNALPWLALGATSLSTTALVGIGRIPISGMEKATSSRYYSMSIYLAVAVLFLAAVWWRSRPRQPVTWGPCLLTALAALMMPAWSYGSEMMRLASESRRHARASLHFINHLTPEYTNRLDATVGLPKIYANKLNHLGLLSPPLAKSLELSEFKTSDLTRAVTTRTFKLVHDPVASTLQASGLAKFGEGPADAVLLTVETGDAKPRIFAIGEIDRLMYSHPYLWDMAQFGRRALDFPTPYSWGKTISAEVWKPLVAAAQPVTIRAWMLDLPKMRAGKFSSAWVLAPDGTLTEKPAR